MVILVAALFAFTQAPTAQLQGVVNDVRCGATRSTDCARPGEPVDFVSDNGLIYTLANPAADLKYVGQHISASGTVDKSVFTIAKVDVLKSPAPFCACVDPNDPQLTPEQEQRVEDAGENPEITPDGPGLVWEAADLAKLTATPVAVNGFNGTWAGNLFARDGLSVVSVRVTLDGEKGGSYENLTDGCRGTMKYLRTDDGVALYAIDITEGACSSANVRFQLQGSSLKWGQSSAGVMQPAAAPVKADNGSPR